MVYSFIYYTLISASIAVLFFTLKPVFNKYIYKLKLESEFLDFLSILLTLEATGLRLDVVLEEASREKLILPSSYVNIAREYGILSRLNPDPYTCIRVLARKIPSSRVSSFFRGYSEVLISSNDTLSYVESFLREELKSIESRIESYVSILDSIYESFLIIILGVIVYSIIPVVFVPSIVFTIIVSIVSSIALLIVYKVISLTLFHYTSFLFYTTVSLVLLTPITIVLPNTILFFYALTIVTGLFLSSSTRDFIDIENNTILMLEDLYSSVRQGFPIDTAIVKASSKYGFPVDLVSRSIKLGFKARSIVKILKIPVFPLRVFNLVLAPIEYSQGFPKYLGYVLSIVDGVKSLRRVLYERSRLYYMYIFILLFVATTMYRVMTSIEYVNTSSELLKGILYSSVFESCILASTISNGYWFRNKLFYIVLTIYLIMHQVLL